MPGFALLIGGCEIVPASPQLALLLVMWMYGAVPGVSYEDYRAAYRAAGGSSQQVERIEECFAQWRAS